MHAKQGGRSKDKAVWAALAGGNLRRALEQLLDAYQEEIYGYCASLVGPSAALRVYERVLMAAVDGLQGLTPGRALRPWFYRLARHAVVHEHQRQRREGSMHDDYRPVDGPDSVIGLGAGADDELQLGSLSPQVREILQLSLWSGLTLAEVAAVLQRPLAEIRRLASQGLGRLAAGRHVAATDGGLPS